jgi:ABC-type amino acid transport substrate-binding protein
VYPDPARMQEFVFSPSYFNAGEVLVVRADSSITGVPDLAGKQVALVFGTQAHMLALQWEKTMPTPPILVVGDAPETITSVLAAGIVDAVILDNVTAQMTSADMPGLRVLYPPVTHEPYTIAARKEDAKLLETISAILNEMQASGELDTLIQQWMQ